MISLNEKCRKAEPWDYVVNLLLYFSDKTLQNVLETEKQKQYYQRNNRGIFLGDLCRIGISYAKYKANKDLCVPIA